MRYFVYLLSGKLLIFLARQFPIIEKRFRQNEDLEKLFNCDLCLGVWFYTGLAFLMDTNLFESKSLFNRFLTGSISSFVMLLLSTGWNALFREYRIE